jgi:hypothetical protein
MGKKKDTSHCVMRNGNFFCNNCGGEKSIPIPLAIDEFSKMAKDFNKLHADCKPTYKPPIVNMELPQVEREKWWLKHGERGASSESLFAKLSMIGLHEPTCNYPYDPSDFSRCYALFQVVPELREQLYKMKSEGKVWTKMVDNWSKLVYMYENEVRGMFHFMRTLMRRKK